jgi:hypothetical protein
MPEPVTSKGACCMSDQPLRSNDDAQSPAEPYEAPKIERVITPEEMEREVLFAGPGITNGDNPLP